MNSISAEKNSTIIFPLPIDLIGSLLGGTVGQKRQIDPQKNNIFIARQVEVEEDVIFKEKDV